MARRDVQQEGVERGFEQLVSPAGVEPLQVLAAFEAAWPANPAMQLRDAHLACAGALTLYFSAWSSFVGMSPWLDREHALPAFDPADPLDTLRCIAGRLCAARLADDGRFADQPSTELFERAFALIQQQLPRLDFAQTLLHTPVLFEYCAVLRRVAEAHELELLFSRDPRFAQATPLAQGRFWDWAAAAYFVLDDRAAAERCENEAKRLAAEHRLGQLSFDLCKRPLRLALEDGRLAHAQALLAEMRRVFNPLNPGDATEYWDMEGRLRLARSEYAMAQDAYRRALAAADAGELPFQRRIVLWSMSGAVHIAMDQRDEAVDKFQRMVDASTGTQREIMLRGLAMTRAWFAWKHGDADAAEQLKEAMRTAAQLNLVRFMRPLPKVAAEICHAALELGAETEFARRVIAARGLSAPALVGPAWPHRLRVFSFGGLRIEISDEPMPRQAKPPVKPMALLRLLAAADGQPQPVGRVLAALWPEAEGEGARGSFDMALARLKKLLGTDDAIRLDSGKLVADPAVWFDTGYLAGLLQQIDLTPPDKPVLLQRLADRLLATYRGAFLQHEDEEPWVLAAREKQQQRFLRGVDGLARKLESAGAVEQARALYEHAIETEPLAEGLYRRLMQLYHQQGSAADAIRVYRRCRQMLSVLLGIAPSRETEALMKQIYDASAG